jgi:hypothetical protein
MVWLRESCMLGSRLQGLDARSIGRDYSQVALDGANEAHMSVPPGPPGRIILGYDSGLASQEELASADVPTESGNRVAV